MKEEAVVSAAHAQASVGPLCVVDDLQRLLNARRSGWTHGAAAMVRAVVAVRKDSIRKPVDRETGMNNILMCVFFLNALLQLKAQCVASDSMCW